MSPALIPLISPLVLLAAAALAITTPGLRPSRMVRLAEAAALVALGAAVMGFLALVSRGMAVEVVGLGLGIRLDALSVTMLLLISFVGWVVMRFACRYLDGEARQGAFLGWTAATMAAVMLLVLSATLTQLVLAWIATSLSLHQLLLFYPERAGAQRAAAKKFVMARAGDAALLGAAVVLWMGYGTQEIAAILTSAAAGETPAGTGWAAALIALAAVLKSAQVPTHGWLTEVMEAPTPVSALLHAGVINAGGFILIRFSDVLLLAPGVLAALVVIGGFTALFGAVVMLTQPAIKTALAWSTVAQMGFMVLQCGLVLFPLALLHIVAHSLYKAHAFLSSGTAVDQVTATKRPGPVAVPGVGAVLLAFGAALGIYTVLSLGLAALGGTKSAQAVALGGILIFGVAYLIAQGLADTAPRALTRRTTAAALAASGAYFALQFVAEALFAGVLPAAPVPDALEWALIALAVGSFGLVAFAQALLPVWSSDPRAQVLRVHVSNGFYLNAALDKALGGWRLRPKA